MRPQLGVENDVADRRGARARGMPLDPLMHRVEARRAQAEAIAEGVHRVWTNARRIVERLTNGKSREHTPAPNGNRSRMAFGRASVADAFSRDLLRLRRLVRASLLEPYARRRRRRIAIDRLKALDDRLLLDVGLRRSDIELAVDGRLPPRSDRMSPRVRHHPPREERRHELPRAA